MLDREDNGWSSYSVDLTEIEFLKFIELVGVKISTVDGQLKFQFPGDTHFVYFESLKDKFKPLGINTEAKKVMLPPNLSIIATMNTSDNSIYFMDNAFKRRWDWDFVSITKDYHAAKEIQLEFDLNYLWVDFVNSLNNFIVSQGHVIRKIEDKQIGYWFIKSKERNIQGSTCKIIEDSQIKNKLLFFLWDSVFPNRKEPLSELLKIDSKELVTFGQLINNYDNFMNKILDLIPRMN
jgi:5-methylcytosine-specific restriction endonuclease McrBC GTP-binding regulatory subunit McrB